METLSFDQVRGLVRDALIAAYGEYQWIVAIYPGSVIFESGAGDMVMESGARKLFRVSYAVGSDQAVTLADDKQEVKETLEYEPVKAATFSLDSGLPEGEFVLRSGKVFEAGDYPDKDFSIDEAELDLAVASFAPVPNDLEHRPTILSGKVGTLEGITRDGKALMGTVKIPKWLDSLIGADPLKVSVAFDRATKRIVGNALTIQPRVGDAQVVAAFTDSANPRKGGMMKKLLQALAAQFSQAAAEAEDEQPGTPAPTVPDVPKPSDNSAEFAALKARNDALEAQLKADSDRKVAEAAAAFAKEAVDSKRAVPSESEALAAMFAQALSDDNSGQVVFSDGVATEGDRVARLRAMVAARIPHNYTDEKLAKFAVSCEGGDIPKTPVINTSAIYDAVNGKGK